MSSSVYSQNFIIKYQEKRNVKIPDNIRRNPLLKDRVKEIVDEKRNTIYLNKVYVFADCIYSKIDSIYYMKEYSNDYEIRTEYNIIEYFNIDNFIYIKDPRFSPNTFKLMPNQIRIREYCDVQKKIGLYECFKIEVEFLSNKYEVWVTNNSKVNGGPLIFSFLPYLVVEVTSETKTYQLIDIIEKHDQKTSCFEDFQNVKSYKDYESKLKLMYQKY